MSLVTFEQARANPEVRQDYLDGINLEEHAQYVDKIKFLDGARSMFGERVLGIHSMAVIPRIRQVSGAKGIKSHIYVSNVAFERIIPFVHEQDFLSCLVDHEGRHAWQLYTNPAKFCGSPLLFAERALIRANDVSELDAYQYQLDKINRGLRVVSEEARNFIQDKVKMYGWFLN